MRVNVWRALNLKKYIKITYAYLFLTSDYCGYNDLTCRESIFTY
jgi:hypothetical protein